MAKKKRNVLSYPKAEGLGISVEIVPGALIIDSVDRAAEMLLMAEKAKEAIAPVLDFIERARKDATDYAVTHAATVIPNEGFYHRRIQRFSRFFDEKALRKVCEGKVAKVKVGGKTKEVPLWNFITKRVPDADKIDAAVNRGFLTDKQVAKAYVQKPQSPFLQRFAGEPKDDEDENDG